MDTVGITSTRPRLSISGVTYLVLGAELRQQSDASSHLSNSAADDALNILKFAVGLTDGPSADWVFVDGDADYSEVDRKNTDYDEGILISDVMTDLSINMTGILVGDVDGSYIA